MPDPLWKLHRLTLSPSDEPLYAALAGAGIPDFTKVKARHAVMGGLVKVDGRVVLDPKLAVTATARIEMDLRQGIDRAFKAVKHGVSAPEGQPLTILHKDSRVIVVDKAAGLMAVPGTPDGAGKVERGHVPELLRRILNKQGQPRQYIGIIHRLDKETSGCLVFALDHEAQRLMGEQFASHAAGRTYRALVEGQPKGDAGEVRGIQGRGRDGRRSMVNDDEAGVEAVTRWRVLRRFRYGAEVEASLETGRTHQIRVAMSDIDCPVFGDRVYRDRRWRLPAVHAPRLMLHAWKLTFDHPSGGKRTEVVAPIPQAFTDMVAQLA